MDVDLVEIPAVDIKEENNYYLVKADMPGVSREDVCVEVGDRVLDISSLKRKEEEEKSEGYLRRERGFVSYCRRLVLPDDASEEGVEAHLEDGVLTLSIPKMEGGRSKKVVEVK